ncbi:MAG: PAS domain S-box protein [Verrucomicrobiota bacterium]
MGNSEQISNDSGFAMENARLQQELDELRAYSREQDDSVELYQLITRHVADLLAIIDTEGRRIWNNRSYRETLGYTPEELESTNSFIEIHPDDRNLVENTFSESIETGVGKTIQYRMKHKQGHWVPLESKAQVVRNPDESVRAVVIVARDMTNRIKSEEEQEKFQKMQALADFSEKVGVSFNEYTAEIISKVGMVSKSLPEGSAERLLIADVMKVADKSQKLVRELMTLSGGGDASYQELDYRALITRAVAENVPKGRGIKLQQQITSLPVIINASQEAITESVAAVLQNAAEAMPKGGVLQVSLTIERREGVATRLQPGTYAALKIRDQGVGFPAHQKNRLFEPYYTTKDGHQGLGLSNALTAITDHKGALFIETKDRVGTEVSIYLPTSSSSPEDIGSNSTLTTFATPTSKPKPKPKPEPEPVAAKSNRRVLIMDSESFVREFSTALFDQIGYQAKAVQDFSELMDEFKAAQRQRKSYHLVVTDVMTPEDAEGQILARRLKAISPFTKVIAVSSYENHPVLLEPESFGFHASMGKPYQLNRISEILNLLFPHSG